ncbi:MAG TPA: stage 0 sporulation family protein [bacterium]|nr:stage 0 sporulation family protein [bacterium]
MDETNGASIVQVEFKGERREYFVNAKGLPIEAGDFVVVQVERGRDVGKVVRMGESLDRMAKAKPVTQEVLRKASPEDVGKYEEIKHKEDAARKVCEDKIRERELKMKLVDVEYQLDGSKITFFFTADERVDFRDLVKDLASIYKTRIELRQIGVRDEAKRLGGYGSCGRKFCCTTFLQEFEPVTLKMARDQSLQVSPTKISGACGRLMCCLAYERDYYMEVAKQLPKIGTKVMTPYGQAIVTKIDIFAQAVTVEDENGNEMRLTLDQIRKMSLGERLMKIPKMLEGDQAEDTEDESPDDPGKPRE